MTTQGNDQQLARIIRDQKEITACALDIVRAVKKRRGRPLQSRDRMALKLLTPNNSALLLKNGVRHLACSQVTFDILTDDLGLGTHRLVPSGVHVLNPETGWWSDSYGVGRFLWNLRLKEEPHTGMARIIEHLFQFKLPGLFGPKAKFFLKDGFKRMTADLDRTLKLYIQRDEGAVETSLRRMVKAKAIFSPKDLGLTLEPKECGHLVLLFGQGRRFGISFRVEKV